MKHVFRSTAAMLLCAATIPFFARPAAAQHGPTDHSMHGQAAEVMPHDMWQASLGGGWSVAGMAQLFPVVTWGAPGGEPTNPFRDTGWYLTQPAVMADLAAPGQRLVLRTTINFEAVTLEDGELTFGGWGEGFLDKRHPHTLLHELMLSWNAWTSGGGGLSLSAGKGFAPYGTDDPMARPGLKYPTNHHLSQILERWTLNAAWLSNGWSVEAGVFGGAEPEGPYDLSNIESFGDSWSARVARRWGGGAGPGAVWEASASYGRVREEHDGVAETTALVNAAIRHAGPELYALLEASTSDPEHADGYFSVLAEARLDRAGHQPYARLEWATRPEYAREGVPGTEGFFRYHHGGDATAASRWLIGTLGYGFEATSYPWSFRPFIEIQHHHVRGARGGLDTEALFGTGSFWSLSAGARIFLGGGPMRMGSYGVLDPMSTMGRTMDMSQGMAGLPPFRRPPEDLRAP